MKSLMVNDIKLLFLVTLGLLVMATSAHAHRVSVFAWVEGDMVYVQSKFSGGRKVKDGLITVTDAAGNELLQGRTDAQGEFAFKIPRRTQLHIILKAGTGHRAQWVLPLADMQPPADTASAGSQKPAAREKPDQAAAVKPQPPAAMVPPVSSRPGPAEIEAAVEKALERKLKPLYKMIAESRQQGPTLADVLGGIGYIIGLVGLAAYVRYRKKNGQLK